MTLTLLKSKVSLKLDLSYIFHDWIEIMEIFGKDGREMVLRVILGYAMFFTLDHVIKTVSARCLYCKITILM